MSKTNIAPLKLLKMACKVMHRAYCPYSNYSVGAALIRNDGKVFLGCNVENASYGLSMCAERIAFWNGISNGGVQKFLAIAIVSSDKQLPYPCGACRQIMAEFCSSDFQIYIATSDTIKSFVKIRLGELFPYSFRL